MTRQNRLHWWSCISGGVVAAALLCENLDGYHNQLGGDYRADLPVINWAHGWPFVGLVRYSPADLTAAEIKAGRRIRPASPKYTSRWPFDGAIISDVYPTWPDHRCRHRSGDYPGRRFVGPVLDSEAAHRKPL
jgi:hypothetical protein